jgi:hypothetical protein
MKRALLCLAVLGVAAFLAGCPIYSNQSDYRVCTGSGCYDCPDPSYSSMCVPWSCNSDSDCGDGYLCSNGGQCVYSLGEDASAPSDCSISGCPAGEICKLAGGAASCVSIGQPSGPDAGSLDDGAGGDAVEEAATSPDALPAEASAEASASFDASDTGVVLSSDADTDGATVPEAAATIACNANGDCFVGASCIDGQCILASQLCSDGSQCATAGDSCVNGICVPQCSTNAPCPTGYACDFGRGVCDVNPDPCVGSGSSTCQGGAVCVESHCVPPCSSAEGGSTCPSGQACVNGGCIPDQKALFSCRNDGASGQLANSCDPASVCVHHDCYTACDGDGGGCPAAECKQVTVHAGTYAVCGTPTTLGSDCDLAAGAACTSPAVCIDGYCR